MITDLCGQTTRALTALRAVLTVHLLAAARPAAEVLGFACGGVFLHELWPPLVWAAASVLLILAGQRR
jgi:hypothetical protein